MDAICSASDLSFPSSVKVNDGNVIARMSERMKMTTIISRRVNPLLHIPTVDVRILAFPALLAVCPVTDDIEIPMKARANIQVRIAPRVQGNLLLFQIAAGRIL